mgnify:FL=1
MSRESRLHRCFASLQAVNERWQTPGVRRWLAASVFIGAAAVLTLAAMRSPGLNTAPPIGGDAVIYDSLGWELANGGGFALDLRDPQFREPYEQVDASGIRRLAETAPQGPIASRPPLLPFLMAGLNRAAGRQFRGIRLVNILAMAAVGAMVAATVCRMSGPLPALLGVFQFLIIDPRVRVASREVLTESLACLLVGLLTVLLVRLLKRPRLGVAIAAGGIVGLAMLNRTMFVLWIPMVAVLIWLMPSALRHEGERSGGRRFPLAVAFVLAAGCVFAPWAWRNCRVLGRFMPLGTQGTMELSAGYSDAAVERWGMWHNLEQTGFFDAVDAPGQTALERENARADHSRRQAIEWCAAKPLKAALLPVMKVFQEFRPHMSGDLYVLAFAILGLGWVRGTPEGRAWLGIIAATAFSVAVTWSVAGRFVFPTLYVLHCAAAIGVWQAIIACTTRCGLSGDGDAT